MTDRPPRVLKFLSAELEEAPPHRCRGRVVLQRHGDEAVAGTVEFDGTCSGPEALNATARAAAQALLRAVDGTPDDRVEIEGVSVSEHFGRPTVCVGVNAHYGGQARQLLGFCVVDAGAPRATALAVLNATNRFLGVG